MNAKISRLIRKFSKVSELPCRKLKSQYNKTPRNKRNSLKITMKEKIEELA